MFPQTITDVYPFNKQCALNIDYQGKEYRVCWSGDWRKPPNLLSFPTIENATSEHISHSREVQQLWSSTRVIIHGSDSHIRELNNCTDGFPVCKVAIDDRQRRFVQDEFSILRGLSSNLPVVQVYPNPLQDENGTFGFRMERLHGIAFEEIAKYLDEMRDAVKKIHEVGIIHYDLSISNIMLSKNGHITLIDFGRAGHIGNKIPKLKEKGVKRTGECVYSQTWDLEAWENIQGMFTRQNE